MRFHCYVSFRNSELITVVNSASSSQLICFVFRMESLFSVIVLRFLILGASVKLSEALTFVMTSQIKLRRSSGWVETVHRCIRSTRMFYFGAGGCISSEQWKGGVGADGVECEFCRESSPFPIRRSARVNRGRACGWQWPRST